MTNITTAMGRSYGMLGYGMRAAIGAKLGEPQRPAVCLTVLEIQAGSPLARALEMSDSSILRGDK